MSTVKPARPTDVKTAKTANARDESASKGNGKTEKSKKTLIWLLVAAACLVLAAVAVITAMIKLGKVGGSPNTPAATREPSVAETGSWVKPQVRIASEQPSLGIAKAHSLEQLTQQADAVLLIRIGDWLGEDTEHGATKYEATVLETIKGDVGEKIMLWQRGSSNGTVPNFPLFTGGNELLVFVKAADEALGGEENAYELVNNQGGVFYSAAVRGDNTRYVLTLSEHWSKQMPQEVPNLGATDYYLGQMRNALALQDRIWDNLAIDVPLIYDYAKLTNAIRGLAG